jgi:glutathione S-transferase
LRAKLYSLSLSHPSQAARLMLERKGIQHEVDDLLPGFHPVLLRLAGFRGGTVPALRIAGRRVQGSLSISRALEAIQPEPALFPAEPERRLAVEQAEAWGERELQPRPPRIFRWAAVHRMELRCWP